MAIKNIITEVVGRVGIQPTIAFIDTDDTKATVTASGYLNKAREQGYNLNDQQFALVKTRDAGTGWYQINKNGNNFDLSGTIPPGIIDSATANRIAIFNNADGQLTQDASTAINEGNIQAGLDGSKGQFIAYPAASGACRMNITSNSSTGDNDVTVTIRDHGQDTQYWFADVGSGDGGVLTCQFASPDLPNANMKWIDLTVTHQGLGGGGQITFKESDGTSNYRIRELYINSGGTNFSGNSGDRDLTITDGTTDFSVIPAGTLQSLANARWGDTGLPFPASASINTQSTNGDAIFVQYSGGSNDYSAGEITITGCFERID